MSDDRERTGNRDSSELGAGAFFDQFTETEEIVAEVERQLGRPMTRTERERVVEHVSKRQGAWTRQDIAGVVSRAWTELSALWREDPTDLSRYEYDPDGRGLFDTLGDIFASNPSHLDESVAVAMGLIEPGEDLAEQPFSFVGGRIYPKRPTGTVELGGAVERAEEVLDLPQQVREAWIAAGRERDDFGGYIIGEQNGVTMAWSPEAGTYEAIFADQDELPPWIVARDPQIASFLRENESQIPSNLAERPEREAAIGDITRMTRPEFEVSRIAEFHEPTYLQGDQWADFATKDPGYITEVQQALAAANLFNPDHIANGVWTTQAAQAMEVAMYEADLSGRTWAEQIQVRAQGLAEAGNAPGSGGGRARRVLVLPSYKKPDLAEIEQTVKDRLRARLNREPREWELALLGEHLSQNHRKQYEADIEALRNEFQTGNRGGGVAAEVQDVNPVARLQQEIEERYAAEIELGEDRLAERQNVANVFSVLGQTQNILGGSVR